MLQPMRLAAVAAVALLTSAANAGTDAATEWIGRMNRALVTRSYEGVLVHQIGPHRSVLRIIHRVQDGRMNERVAVVSSEGPGREYVRNGSEWVAYYPDQRIALVQTRNRSFGFLTALNGFGEDAARYYTITDAGSVHLQDHDAELIQLEPRDALRYGYRFWLDSRTALPLKTQLVARSGEVLEEISFLSLSLPEKISDDMLKPELDTAGFHWLKRDVPIHNPGITRAFAPRTELLPAGFRVRTFSTPEEEAKAQGPRTRFIVSDGIAWVSVFVEKAEAKPDAKPGPEAGKPQSGDKSAGGRGDGVVLMGSSAAYVARVGDINITVVGEVPPATVKSIAEAVQPE